MVELDVQTRKGNIRGGSREAYQELSDKITSIEARIREKQENINFGISLLSADDDQAVSKDPDFRPRIVQDLEGSLFIRARNPVEAGKFIELLLNAAHQNRLSATDEWRTVDVPAGTPMTTKIRWNEEHVGRVIGKVAYAVAALACTNYSVPRPNDAPFREFIINRVSSDDVQVGRLCGPGTVKELTDSHCIVLRQNEKGALEALVSIFGGVFRVGFSVEWPSGLPMPVVARTVLGESRKSEFVDIETARGILVCLRDYNH